MKEALEENGGIILDNFKDRCKKDKVECDTILTSGIVANEICDKGVTSDLIIVGRRGINEKFEHGLLGSATEGVIRKSQRPVFIAPREFSPVKKPMLCYDASPNAAKAMQNDAASASSG